MAKSAPKPIRRPTNLARLDTWVETGLLEDARNAVAFLSRGPVPTLTMVALIDAALTAELKRLRRAHGIGPEGFPTRRGELKRGLRSRVIPSKQARP